MKKFLINTGIVIVSLAVILYLAFLFVIPNAVNLNNFMPDIKKAAAEQANLILDIDNPKIVTTPLLGAGLKTDKISVKFPDGSELLKADNSIIRVSLPHLIFLTVKVTKAQVENPVVNIDIVDGKEYKILKNFENINQEEIQTASQTAEKPMFDVSSIKINVPAVRLVNYAVLINDLKTSDYLKLRGDELLLGYKNGKTASLKTIAELFINETKNITANVDIDTFLPEISENESSESAENNDIPFINPVAVYKAYNLKTNVDSKIKIREKDKQIISNGHINIDNLTLNIGGIQLPESKVHLATKGTEVNIDSELFAANDEKVDISGVINYSKKPALDMKIKSNEIKVDNILKLAEAALNSAQIQNELDTVKGEGYFKADANIKTDFKKLDSNGDITIYNCIIRDAKNNSRIARINSVISLDNSILKFVDTYVELLDAVFKIDGTIDESSKADITLLMEKMPVKKLFTLFAPAEIAKDYTLNTGDIDLTAKITGELQKAAADVKLSLGNLSLTDNVNNINYFNNLLTADFNSDFKTYKGKINNSDFRLTMNGASVDCDSFALSVDDKDIAISPSKIKINNSTVINVSGEVKDYINKPEFKINADGNLITKDLKKLLGPDIALYIKEKGSLPLKASVTGDSKTQTLKASIDADKDNYITFADISNVLNKNTTIQTVVDLKGDTLKIKDTGFYIKNGSNLEEVVSIDGTITKLDTKTPSINLIKLKMPKEVNASLVVFPKSKMTAKGSAFISGDLNQPKIKGDVNISNMSIPELFVTMKNAAAKFEGNNLDIDISNLTANDSDFDILMNADLSQSANFVIKTLNLKSNYTDADKLMQVSDAAAKYTTPASSSSSSGSSVNSSNSSIPVVIKDGTVDMKQIKSGTITLTDTTSKISLSNNIVYLNNLVTNAFKGKISGNVSMNIVSGEIKANVKGSGLDVEQTLLDAAAMKDTLTGTMDFDANISLKGSTYEEQVKSLKGDVNFTMKDGSLGPIGKLENLVSADNIKSIALLKTVVGTALKSTYDTSKYNTLKGHISFNNGVAQINPITSAGDYMSAYIFGNFDVLKNTADMKLRGRLGSKVTDSMGQLAALNPVNAVKSSSGMNVILGQLLMKMCEQVTTDELAQIPAVSKESSDSNTAKFQVVLRGDAAKPQSLVRSFKWLALESEIKEAQETLSSLGAVSIPTSASEAKQQAKELVKGLVSDGTKESLNQAKETVNSVKSLLNSSSSSNGASLKDQLKQTQKNAWSQLKEQAKQAVTDTSGTTQTQE